MEEFKLSPKEAFAIKALIEPSASKVIVFKELQYVGSKKFSRDESVYHIFGAFNEAFNCWQRVTYSPTSESLEFTLYSVEQKS